MNNFPEFSIISANKYLSKESFRKTREAVDLKPRGLWFSRGNEWFKWTADEYFYEYETYEKLYLYSIQFIEDAFINSRDICYVCVDKHLKHVRQILVIDSIRDYVRFHKHFQTEDGYVDWRSVQRCFAGFYLNFRVNYDKIKQLPPGIIHSLLVYDVRSGSIWDSRVIKKIEKVDFLSNFLLRSRHPYVVGYREWKKINSRSSV